MTTVIQTNRSALLLHELDDDTFDLVQTCVNAVDTELNVTHEIQMCGTSDTSITPSKPVHPCLRELLLYINDKFDYRYNGILINKCEGGDDYIGKQSDYERGLDAQADVIAISCGAVRKFRVRHKSTGVIAMDVPTHPRHLIQMVGDFQKEFTHEFPVEKKVKGVRWSLTFRRHLE